MIKGGVTGLWGMTTILCGIDATVIPMMVAAILPSDPIQQGLMHAQAVPAVFDIQPWVSLEITALLQAFTVILSPPVVAVIAPEARWNLGIVRPNRGSLSAKRPSGMDSNQPSMFSSIWWGVTSFRTWQPTFCPPLSFRNTNLVEETVGSWTKSYMYPSASSISSTCCTHLITMTLGHR